MTNKLFKFGLVLLMFAAVFTGCKKGEEDPSISLLSRTARLTGDWNLTTGDWTVTDYNAGKGDYSVFAPVIPEMLKKKLVENSKGQMFTNTYSVADGILTLVDSDGESQSGQYTDNVIFNKDGSFSKEVYGKITYTYGDYSYYYEYWDTIEGSWYFMDGNDDLDMANNQRVVLQVNRSYDKTIYSDDEGNSENNEYTELYEGASNDNFDVIVLKKLANKEIIITLDSKDIEDDGDYSQFVGEMTYTQE